MGLEECWQVFSTVALFVTAPLWFSSMLDSNPFSKGKGWAAIYTDELKKKDSPRSSPVGIPLLASAIVWAIVAAAAAIPTYTIYHNSGLNDGWTVNPVPLIFAYTSLFFNTIWLPVYLSSCEACYNIGFVQVLAIVTSVISFAFALSSDTAIYYSILSIGMIIWASFWWLKTYFEENKRCNANGGWIRQCTTAIFSA